jgi:hypothetical protein
MASIFIINDMTPEEKKDKSKIWNKASIKRYHDKNKEHLKEYRKQYAKKQRQNNPLYKLNRNIRSLISNSISNKGYTKSSRSTEILGCTYDEFKHHLESQFEPWMTWDNYGCKVPSGPDVTWDLDHIIPVSSAINEDDIKRLNHYTNFQPLCSFQNRFMKRDNI